MLNPKGFSDILNFDSIIFYYDPIFIHDYKISTLIERNLTFSIRYKFWKESRDLLFFIPSQKSIFFFDVKVSQNLFRSLIFGFIIEFAFAHLEV